MFRNFFAIIFIIFLSFQIYNYISVNELKKTSIKFFNSIEAGDDINEALYDLQSSDNIFSTLSYLKLIQKNNNQNNFSISNEMYKELILSSELNDLFRSSIAIHASYTLINASYVENSLKYKNDILIFIDNINDDLESYYSIKNELKYLLLVTEIDINKLEYKNQKEAKEMFNDIFNSSLISSTVKERVKKIHEFQIYK